MGAARIQTIGLRAAPDDLGAARRALTGALPGDVAHEAARARILDFVDAHPDALLRACEVGHLTGSALVVDPSSRQVLLLFHAKMRRWLQPGGHADGDGNLAHVSLREAAEESGIQGLRVVTPAIDLDVHVFHHARGAEPDHLHLDVRHLVIAPPAAHAPGNHESEGIRWVTLDALSDLEPEPGLLRMARTGLALLDRLDLAAVLESPPE
ncbi:MAG: NUDIX hydrolase [Chloroflexota bacterium]